MTLCVWARDSTHVLSASLSSHVSKQTLRQELGPNTYFEGDARKGVWEWERRTGKAMKGEFMSALLGWTVGCTPVGDLLNCSTKG